MVAWLTPTSSAMVDWVAPFAVISAILSSRVA